MRNSNIGSLILLGAIMMTGTSCDHKDLCFDHSDHAPKYMVNIQADYRLDWEQRMEGGVDWQQNWQERFQIGYNALRPGIPEGLRIQFYNAEGRTYVMNTPATGDVVMMMPGEHSLLFYNNDTEYIVFDDMDSYALARATTRTRMRSSYRSNPEWEINDERCISEPDMLYGCYIDSYEAKRDVQVNTLNVTMNPVVFKYLVRYEFSHGLEYVALARGAMAGMAEAVWLYNGHTSDSSATILYDCTIESYGAEAVVKTFGVPDYPNAEYTTRGDDRRYGLTLEVRLKNGDTKSFDFDITEQVKAQPQGGVIEVRGIEITDEEGSKGGSGFDVDLEGWGEYEDIELPLK
ncbi:MAG: DUF5119 domain-containing protein [Lepagella sp.]